MTQATPKKTFVCRSRMSLTSVILGSTGVCWVWIWAFTQSMMASREAEVKFKQSWWVLPNDGMPRIKGKKCAKGMKEHDLMNQRLL